jgi:hypothetical protein
MSRTTSRRLALLGMVLVAGMGCNPLTAPFFFLFGYEDKIPPEYALVPKEKGDPVKVVVLVSASGGVSPEFVGLERDLHASFTAKLNEFATLNKEKIQVVPLSKVDRYKAQHSDWRIKGPKEIGKHFQAEYVVELSVATISLFEPQSMNQLYRGNCEINVDAHDVNSENEAPAHRSVFNCVYPRISPKATTDISIQNFKKAYIDRVAVGLAWKFVPRTTAEDFKQD